MSSRSSSPRRGPRARRTGGGELPSGFARSVGEGRITELKVGIVVSTFNAEIAGALLEGCRAAMDALRMPAADVRFVHGALEIPYMAKRLAMRPGYGIADTYYDGLIALGCIVRGETHHFNVVADVSARGLQDVQLETMVPVANGILTVDSMEQARARAADKPRQCVEALLSMLA